MAATITTTYTDTNDPVELKFTSPASMEGGNVSIADFSATVRNTSTNCSVELPKDSQAFQDVLAFVSDRTPFAGSKTGSQETVKMLIGPATGGASFTMIGPIPGIRYESGKSGVELPGDLSPLLKLPVVTAACESKSR